MDGSKTAQSRADAVRQRREARVRKGSPRSGSRAKKSAPSTMPPILMRGSLFGQAVEERPRGKKAKRRYDIGLGIPGAEMQLPALPRIAFGWRLLSGLLVAALGFALYTVWSNPLFQVQSLEVQGLRRLTSEDLNAVADVIGNSIVVVQPQKIQQDLSSAFPELASVSVKVNLPAGVTVQAVERRPVLIWKQGDQKTWVDSEGMAFPSQDEGGPKLVVKAVDVPPAVQPTPRSDQAEGEVESDETDPGGSATASSAPFISPQLVQAIVALKADTPEKTPIVYSYLHGLGWQDPRGWQVYFGTDLDEMDLKLQLYKAIVKRLKKEGVKPSMISVEHVHAPYYRVE